jgi:hypothetical protein
MLGICLGLAVTALWMITDGPMGVRIEQVMEGKATREIQMKAEAATAKIHLEDKATVGAKSAAGP